MTKKICITGASKGIGLAEAKKFQQENELFLVASKLESFTDKRLDDCRLFGYDLSDLNSLNKFTSELTERTESIDVLINNVGIMVMKKFGDMTDEDIIRSIDINLRANILITRKLLPLLLKASDPQIIFMSSMAAKSSIIGESVYAATKAGITNFANVLRNELSEKVRVSVVHSWGVDTWDASEDANVLQPEDIADVLEFIITRERPFLIESIDLSHEKQWRGSEAPWSPK